MKQIFQNFVKFSVYIFAFIGCFLLIGFFAMKFHLTDTKGVVDFSDRRFQANLNNSVGNVVENKESLIMQCKLGVIKQFYPPNYLSIMENNNLSASLLMGMIEAISIRSEDSGFKKELNNCNSEAYYLSASNNNANAFSWVNTEDWQVFKEAIVKDKDVINKVSQETGVEPRLIVAQVFSEQIRLFNSSRETFKQFFQPLKILGNEVQFSLGVAGVKEETAREIEINLKNSNSLYYPGQQYENLLEFKTDNPDKERVDRLTEKHDRYYSYLYTALYIKEIEVQWQKAGYDITKRPEIISTLFNIGFRNSKPGPNPQVGGSQITLDGVNYTFGSLGYEFYYSGELSQEFAYWGN